MRENVKKHNQTFWKTFASKHWEKAPFKMALGSLGISKMDDDAIFKMLLEYSNLCRQKQEVQGLKLFVDGVRQYDEEVLQILPVKKDKNLIGYHQRVSAIYPDYCLVCDELLQVSSAHWPQLVDFTQGLYNQIGLPYRFTEMGLYLGNYRKTPFGVHVDGCGVFSFPVVGRKKFRLWTSEFADKNSKLKETFKYTKFKSASELMVVEPGEMSYWPSKAWHIAESSGEFSATWSLGVWVDRKQKDFVLESLTPLILQQLGDAPTLANGIAELGQVKSLPDGLRNALVEYKNISQAVLSDHLLRSWLLHCSKQGFKTAPLLKEVLGLKKNSVACGVLARPIFWAKSSDSKTLFVAFNGVLIDTAFDFGLVSLMKDLNAGLGCEIAKYFDIKSFSRQKDALAELARVGAVQLSKK